MRTAASQTGSLGGAGAAAALHLAYTEAGSGDQALVLLHGYTDAAGSFDLVVPRLARRFRCLAPDLRAHGRSAYAGGDFLLSSMAGDVIALLDRLGVRRAVLVGHSMGSFIARRVALARPDRVDRLVLVGSGLRADNAEVRALRGELDAFEGGVPHGFAHAFQSSCVVDPDGLRAGFLDACVRTSAAFPLRAWRSALDALIEDDHTDSLARIGCPTLVIGGREDHVFPAEEQAELVAHLPDARLVLYEGTGHSPHWEAPERFAADVEKFAAASAGGGAHLIE